MPSQPPSRSNSLYPTANSSRSSTPAPFPRSASIQSGQAPASSSKQEHTTTFSHKLMNLFSSQPTAEFDVDLTIHELSNVPQLNGEFAVAWKFRAHRPKGKKERGTSRNVSTATPKQAPQKPSLPNIKLNQTLSTIQPSPSSSSISIQTSSSNSTSIPADTLSAWSNTVPGRRTLPAARSKALSLPPQAFTKVSDEWENDEDHKKVDSPTDISLDLSDRQASVHRRNSESPVPESIQGGKTDSIGSGSTRSSGSGSGASGSSIRTSTSQSAATRETLHTGNSDASVPSVKLPAGPVSALQDEMRRSSASLPSGQNPLHRTASFQSTHSHLSLPPTGFARPPPEARSGNTPHISSIVEPPSHTSPSPPPENKEDLSRRQSVASNLSRSTSGTSAASGKDTEKEGAAPGPSDNNGNGQNHFTQKRKGETSIRKLKAHGCSWDAEVSYTCRVKLYRPSSTPATVVTPGTNTPIARPRPSAAQARFPALGAGPLSDSGLSLEIWQTPTPTATSSSKATGANKDSLSSMLQAQHQLNHGDGKQNPSERGSGSSDSVKTSFGTVNIDLAPFAGKGPLTRQFLLDGGRTNAMIKVSINMKWVGGQQDWIAPPMKQGHHVTGMHDLVGTEGEDRMRGDLALAKTTSKSSSGGSMASDRTRSYVSNRSAASSLAGSRNHSVVSLQSTGLASGKADHLRPESAGRRGGPNSDALSLGASQLSLASSSQSGVGNAALRSVNNFDEPSVVHPSVPLPASIATLHPPAVHRHHHHAQHLRSRPHIPHGDRLEHLPPDVVIEAIFNPVASFEDSPFTYVPPGADNRSLESSAFILQRLLASAAGLGVAEPEEGSLSTRDEEEDDFDADEGTNGNGKKGHGWGEKFRARRERKASKKITKSMTAPAPLGVETEG